MFFLTILVMFGMFGTLFMMVDLWFPITLIPMVKMGLQTMGAMLLWIGVGLYVMRSYSTGANVFLDLPNSNQTICIHQGKSNARFIRGRKQEPNRISARGKGYRNTSKYMNIKDTGEPFNVAGHDVVVTSQDVGHNFPMWVVDYIDKIKRNWKVKNEGEFFKLYKLIEGVRSHDELFNIPELKPLFVDEGKREYFRSVDLDDLKEMKMLIYDGRVINFKQYLDWSESATPYDNESIIDSDVSHKLSQMQNFLNKPGGDMMRMAIIAGVILMFAVIGYKIVGG